MDIELLTIIALRSLIVFSPIAAAFVWAVLIYEEMENYDIW